MNIFDKHIEDTLNENNKKRPSNYWNILTKYYQIMGNYVLVPKIIEEIRTQYFLNIEHETIRADLKKVKSNNQSLTPKVTDIDSYLKMLKVWYEFYDSNMLSDDKIKDFIGCYFLYTKFGITCFKVIQDLKVIKDQEIYQVSALSNYENNVEKSVSQTSNTTDSKTYENDTVPIEVQKAIFGVFVSDEPIYDNLDLSDMGEFHAYVTSYGNNQLISAIKTQYLKFKNTCKYAPALGINGCLEFAGGLLLSLYLIEKANKAKTDSSYSKQQIKTLCDELISLMIIIFSAFLGSTPTEWSNMADKFAENSSFLTKREWSIVYLYLRDNHADDIRKMEFNAGNSYSHLADRKKTADVLATAKGDLGMLKRYFVSEGLLVVW